jgi:hypothetical protein
MTREKSELRFAALTIDWNGMLIKLSAGDNSDRLKTWNLSLIT